MGQTLESPHVRGKQFALLIFVKNQNFILLNLVTSLALSMQACQFKKSESNVSTETNKAQKKESQVRDPQTGKTIYELAAESNSLRLENFLKDNPELNVNIAGDNDRTALEIAVRSGYVLNVKLLLSRGALPLRPTAEGKSLFNLAEKESKIYSALQVQVNLDENKFSDLLKEKRFKDALNLYSDNFLDNIALENNFIKDLFESNIPTAEILAMRSGILRSDTFSRANYVPALKHYSDSGENIHLNIVYAKIEKGGNTSYEASLKDFLEPQTTEAFLSNLESTDYWRTKFPEFSAGKIQTHLNYFDTLSNSSKIRLVSLVSYYDGTFKLSNSLADGFLKNYLDEYFNVQPSIKSDKQLSQLLAGYFKLVSDFGCAQCILSLIQNDPKQNSYATTSIKKFIAAKDLSPTLFADVISKGVHFSDFESISALVSSTKMAKQKAILQAAIQLPASEFEFFYVSLMKIGNLNIKFDLQKALEESLNQRWKSNKNAYEVSKVILGILTKEEFRLAPQIGASYFAQEIKYCSSGRASGDPLLIKLSALLDAPPEYLDWTTEGLKQNTTISVSPKYYYLLSSTLKTSSQPTNSAVLYQISKLYPNEEKGLTLKENLTELHYHLIELLAVSVFLDSTQNDLSFISTAILSDKELAFKFLVSEFRPNAETKNVYSWLYQSNYLQKALTGNPDEITRQYLATSFHRMDLVFDESGMNIPKMIVDHLGTSYSANRSEEVNDYLEIFKAAMRVTNPRLFISSSTDRIDSYIKLITNSNTDAVGIDPLCKINLASSFAIIGIDGEPVPISDDGSELIKGICNADINKIQSQESSRWQRRDDKRHEYPVWNPVPTFASKNMAMRALSTRALQKEWLLAIKRLDGDFSKTYGITQLLNYIPNEIRNFNMDKFVDYAQINGAYFTPKQIEPYLH